MCFTILTVAETREEKNTQIELDFVVVIFTLKIKMLFVKILNLLTGRFRKETVYNSKWTLHFEIIENSQYFNEFVHYCLILMQKSRCTQIDIFM